MNFKILKNRRLLASLVGCILISLSLAACDSEGNTQQTTIYTPKGTAVTAYTVLSEMSQGTIDEINQQVEDNYPNVYKLREPTAYYNCHSYAWYSQSTSNNIWLNSPEQEKYWTDGSYGNTCSTNYATSIPSFVPNGAKVSYRNGDHSAIKTSSTEFISKWGNGGLYRHKPADCPYTFTWLDYYTKN